jgi:hypothetical protein
MAICPKHKINHGSEGCSACQEGCSACQEYEQKNKYRGMQTPLLRVATVVRKRHYHPEQPASTCPDKS